MTCSCCFNRSRWCGWIGRLRLLTSLGRYLFFVVSAYTLILRIWPLVAGGAAHLSPWTITATCVLPTTSAATITPTFWQIDARISPHVCFLSLSFTLHHHMKLPTISIVKQHLPMSLASFSLTLTSCPPVPPKGASTFLGFPARRAYQHSLEGAQEHEADWSFCFPHLVLRKAQWCSR